MFSGQTVLFHQSVHLPLTKHLTLILKKLLLIMHKSVNPKSRHSLHLKIHYLLNIQKIFITILLNNRYYHNGSAGKALQWRKEIVMAINWKILLSVEQRERQ